MLWMKHWGAFLRWAAAEYEENDDDVSRLEGESNLTAAGEWLRVIHFETILSTVHVIRANIATHPITTELAWPGHGLYINRFY